MKRDLVSRLIFFGSVAVAFALYALTWPIGLPWNASTHLALAYLGEIVPFPVMPHPIWGFYVQVFGGHILLSAGLVALAAGFLGLLIYRYFGWRLAVSTVSVWIFLPGVWNRAITGERIIVLVAMAIIALWVVNALVLFVTRKARVTVRAAATSSAATSQVTPSLPKRIIRWSLPTMAGLFVLGSLVMHDYRFGEAATAFANGVAGAAGDRIIVLNGVCDDQMVRVAKDTITLRNDDAYRSNLVAWVRRLWPKEMQFRVAAQVSPEAFIRVASSVHPERFYFMNGKSTTLASWSERWSAFQPYLKSSDPFVSVARRLFAYEGNVVANGMPDTDKARAWQFYKRLCDEIDPDNISALVNMSEMIRRGYVAGEAERKHLHGKLEKFFRDPYHREHAREIVRSSGPIRSDPALIEKLAAEAKKRIAARIAAGEKIEPSTEIMTLVEWNNEMVGLMNKGETEKAGRIARTILSKREWEKFVPANAVMGDVAAKEGDHEAAETFYRMATVGTNDVPAATLNNYADTLMHLGKLDDAEAMARRAVQSSDENFWIARLTLAEILLSGKSRNSPDVAGEIRALLKAANKHVPPAMREKVRTLQREVNR